MACIWDPSSVNSPYSPFVNVVGGPFTMLGRDTGNLRDTPPETRPFNLCR